MGITLQTLIAKQDEFKKSMESAKVKYNSLGQIDSKIKQLTSDNNLFQMNDNPYTILNQEVRPLGGFVNWLFWGYKLNNVALDWPYLIGGIIAVLLTDGLVGIYCVIR